MKLKNLLITGALAASALGAIPAQAFVAGTTGTVGNNFYGLNGADPALLWTSTSGGRTAGIDGYFGANLGVSGSDGTATVTATIYGMESGYANSFKFGPTTTQFPVTTSSGNFGLYPAFQSQYTVGSIGNGLLLFSFGINSATQTLFNGLNPSTDATPNFFTSFGAGADTFAVSGTTVWLFLDDAGGNPADDDNHDDYIVKLFIQGGQFFIPEPATLSLLGMGLLGLGLARRKRA